MGKSKKGGKGGGAPSAALLKETSSCKAHKYTSSDESSIEIGGSHFAVRSGGQLDRRPRLPLGRIRNGRQRSVRLLR